MPCPLIRLNTDRNCVSIVLKKYLPPIHNMCQRINKIYTKSSHLWVRGSNNDMHSMSYQDRRG
jgi:hypothetical protein